MDQTRPRTGSLVYGLIVADHAGEVVAVEDHGACLIHHQVAEGVIEIGIVGGR